jgi:hypothetical protein
MQAERREHLQRIVALSDDMLHQAQEGEWGRVGELEFERRQLIQDFFAQAAQPEEAAAIASGIEQIKACDRQLITLGTELKDELAGKLSEFTARKRARNAYSE